MELIFVAANDVRRTCADKLVSITSDIGTVTLPATARCRQPVCWRSATPDGQRQRWQSVERRRLRRGQVELTKPITNGLTYDFTFTFEQAGDTTVARADLGGRGPAS